MIEPRPHARLGTTTQQGSPVRHHFCFAAYQHPDRMSWGGLRLCDDRILPPRTRLPDAFNHDMNLITWVRRGSLRGRGFFGEKAVLRSGEVEAVISGRASHLGGMTGPEEAELVTLWIPASQGGASPRRAVTAFPAVGDFKLLASGRTGDDGAPPIRADARILGATIGPGEQAVLDLDPARLAYALVMGGMAAINGIAIGDRDGAAIAGESRLVITAGDGAQILLADVPAAA